MRLTWNESNLKVRSPDHSRNRGEAFDRVRGHGNTVNQASKETEAKSQMVRLQRQERGKFPTMSSQPDHFGCNKPALSACNCSPTSSSWGKLS
ncbi:hypothetical protein EG327_001157 [Venturia inaequalis]|uniref:Uncharacterized protein n=1 Tax=Venturia inaequalis TaxID=5025 RepID=A0A8H3VMN1_VENIN|nr:hypothetical protein EG327_001157 [Venturia inaequalis]